MSCDIAGVTFTIRAPATAPDWPKSHFLALLCQSGAYLVCRMCQSGMSHMSHTIACNRAPLPQSREKFGSAQFFAKFSRDWHLMGCSRVQTHAISPVSGRVIRHVRRVSQSPLFAILSQAQVALTGSEIDLPVPVARCRSRSFPDCYTGP